MFQSCRYFCLNVFLQCWLCPRCDRNTSQGIPCRKGLGSGEDGSSQWKQGRACGLETQGLQCWQVPLRALQGGAVPGLPAALLGGTTLGPGLAVPSSQCSSLELSPTASLWPGPGCGCCELKPAVGVFMGRFLPWAELLLCAKGWSWEGVRESGLRWVSPSTPAGPAGLSWQGLEAPSPSTCPFCWQWGERSRQ